MTVDGARVVALARLMTDAGHMTPYAKLKFEQLVEEARPIEVVHNPEDVDQVLLVAKEMGLI